MVYKIAIIGAGQLGSRYLQGLSKVGLSIEIFVVDININSLNLAKKRWGDVSDNQNIVNYTSNIDSLPMYLNLAIIATNSDSRTYVSSLLLKNRIIDFVILEKVLAQSINAIIELKNIFLNKSTTWVNTFFRTIDYFKELKNKSAIGPITLNVKGGNWGIACNTIHILDFILWWTGEQILNINTSDLDKQWKKSKRDKFWELNGTLVVNYSSGSIARLVSDDNDSNFIIEINTKENKWVINWDKDIENGKIPMQSDRTHIIVENILINNKCGLPTLEQSSQLHNVFLEAMISHWNSSNNINTNKVPIT